MEWNALDETPSPTPAVIDNATVIAPLDCISTSPTSSSSSSDTLCYVDRADVANTHTHRTKTTFVKTITAQRMYSGAAGTCLSVSLPMHLLKWLSAIGPTYLYAHIFQLWRKTGITLTDVKRRHAAGLVQRLLP